MLSSATGLQTGHPGPPLPLDADRDAENGGEPDAYQQVDRGHATMIGLLEHEIAHETRHPAQVVRLADMQEVVPGNQ